MIYSTTKFEVATSSGLGEDDIYKKRDGQTEGRRTDFDTKLIDLYPFYLKKKSGYNKPNWAFTFPLTNLFIICYNVVFNPSESRS